MPCLLSDMDQPALLSAGSLWDKRRRCFRKPGDAIQMLDCALDSSGYVRMKAGGYPWEVSEYVNLAASHEWAWWAQMDLPCEPELASDRQRVRGRQFVSAHLLAGCLAQARIWRDQGCFWLTDPVPVLQGWHPEDYQVCAEKYDEVLRGRWPELVAVGSMCRRHLRGPDSLGAVLQALEVLPKHVRLHLFGVKGSALAQLRDNPRIASVDSQAWDFAARQRARKEGRPCSNDLKVAELKCWLARQLPSQPVLFQ